MTMFLEQFLIQCSCRSPATWKGQCGRFRKYRLSMGIDAMKYLKFGSNVCLLIFLGMASEVSASSWTCRKDGFTREVVVFYPEAPAQLPCKVFYAKPKENVLPHALWEAKNTQNYCKQKAEEFIDKLSSLGWHCFSDDLEEKPNN